MVSRLYLGNDDAHYDPATERGAWDATTSYEPKRLTRRRTGPGNSIALPEVNAAAAWDRLLAKFVSDPIAAVTISGTLDLRLHMAEDNADADMYPHIHAYVTQGDTDTLRGTLLTDYIGGSELPVTATAGRFDAVNLTGVALASVACSTGDRIVIEIGYRAQNTHTTSRSGRIRYGGAVTDATGSESNIQETATVSPWVEFSTDLTFTWTYLSLGSGTPPASPGATRGTWNDAASPVDGLLAVAPAGARVVTQRPETTTTNPWDVLVGRFVSPPLAAQTIDQPVRLLSGLREDNAAANAFAKYHLYVMAPDGTVRGTLAANQVGGVELTNLTSQLHAQVAVTSVAATALDRLVLEVGARFTNTVTTTYNAELNHGGASADMGAAMALTDTDTAPWLRLGQIVTFLPEPGDATPRSQAIIVA